MPSHSAGHSDGRCLFTRAHTGKLWDGIAPYCSRPAVLLEGQLSETADVDTVVPSWDRVPVHCAKRTKKNSVVKHNILRPSSTSMVHRAGDELAVQ